MSRFRTHTAGGVVAAVIAVASFGTAGAGEAAAKGDKATKPAAGLVKGKSGVRHVRAKATGRKVG